MAYICPSDITELALAGRHAPELETLGRLKKELSADYTVYHGVHWSRSYRGHTVFGEIDFVVVNRAGEVLLIEQKNGRLEETENGLLKHYLDGPKNVADQVRRSLENVREKWKWRHGPNPPLQLDYLIYCPDHRLARVNAAALDENRIIDAASATELAHRIDEILGPGAETNPTWTGKVHEFFAQSFEIVPDIHARVSAQQEEFTRLSGGLADVIDSIEMSPLRLRVRGTAGCGKSQIAHRAYTRALATDRKPLLVCFSRPLRERLNARLGNAGGLVQTWMGLGAEFLTARGRAPNFEEMKRDPGFWRKVADMMVEESVPEEWRFDTLIVDEGQDFEQSWWDILQLFLAEDADVLWLEDADQNINDKVSVALEGFVGFHARQNFRTPESIARYIRKVLPFDFIPANDLPGMGVGEHICDSPTKLPSVVGRVVSDLLGMGFDYDDIVVLTCRGIKSSDLSGLATVGPHPLRTFTGDYDAEGNQTMTDGRLLFDSIRRFKGQQAPAVILVDTDPGTADPDLFQRLLYCGMTRATVRLEIVRAG